MSLKIHMEKAGFKHTLSAMDSFCYELSYELKVTPCKINLWWTGPSEIWYNLNSRTVSFPPTQQYILDQLSNNSIDILSKFPSSVGELF